MLYAHVVEAFINNVITHVLIFRDFCEFYSPQEREGLTPYIRWTFKEPSGIRGLLNAQIADWTAKNKDVSVVGISSTSKYFKPDTETYIKQLESRIEQMTTLLMNWQDGSNKETSETDLNETECPAHERLDRLQAVVQCAQQNGCRHIDEAIKELDHGGKNGH